MLNEKVKAEMHQSVVEVGTGVCRDITEARAGHRRPAPPDDRLAEQNGLLLVAGATHPFADWRVQDISPDERYLQVVEDLQLVARANLIFGLHVHVGIEDREIAIQLMNQVRYFLPHLLALSTNSPFWLGMNTGLKSYRCKVFDKFPRTNIPDAFSRWADFESFVNLLIRTNCIDNAKKIWWDMRPHPFFSTLEVPHLRHADAGRRDAGDRRADPGHGRQAVAAARQESVAIAPTAARLIMENKWRAARYGIDGALIDFGREAELPERELLDEYLAFVDDVLDELGSRQEVEHIRWIMEHGSGADRQLAEFERSNDLRQVVAFMARETQAGSVEDAHLVIG